MQNNFCNFPLIDRNFSPKFVASKYFQLKLQFWISRTVRVNFNKHFAIFSSTRIFLSRRLPGEVRRDVNIRWMWLINKSHQSEPKLYTRSGMTKIIYKLLTELTLPTENFLIKTSRILKISKVLKRQLWLRRRKKVWINYKTQLRLN